MVIPTSTKSKYKEYNKKYFFHLINNIKKSIHRRSRNLPPEAHNRITHYYGDGKGRDNHVTITDGG
jgi:hypothetical protein